jgi:hypothetical protein
VDRTSSDDRRRPYKYPATVSAARVLLFLPNSRNPNRRPPLAAGDRGSPVPRRGYTHHHRLLLVLLADARWPGSSEPDELNPYSPSATTRRR